MPSPRPRVPAPAMLERYEWDRPAIARPTAREHRQEAHRFLWLILCITVFLALLTVYDSCRHEPANNVRIERGPR